MSKFLVYEQDYGEKELVESFFNPENAIWAAEERYRNFSKVHDGIDETDYRVWVELNGDIFFHIGWVFDDDDDELGTFIVHKDQEGSPAHMIATKSSSKEAIEEALRYAPVLKKGEWIDVEKYAVDGGTIFFVGDIEAYKRKEAL